LLGDIDLDHSVYLGNDPIETRFGRTSVLGKPLDEATECKADNPYAQEKNNHNTRNNEQQDEHDRSHMILLSLWSARHTSICDPCVLAS